MTQNMVKFDLTNQAQLVTFLRKVIGRRKQRANKSVIAPVGIAELAVEHGLVQSGRMGEIFITDCGKNWLRKILSAGEGTGVRDTASNQRGSGKMKPAAMAHTPASTSALFNDRESPLFWLSRRKDRQGQPLIAAEQLDAGERLRADYTFAGLMQGGQSNWRVERVDCSGSGANDLSDNAMDARVRVEKALACVGPELSGVLLDICCYLKGLGLVEKERSWPERTAKVVLGLGLDRLAAHYTQPRQNNTAQIQSWHDVA